MKRCSHHYAAFGALAFGIMLVFSASPGMAQPRAHVYLFRGLADVFSRGMDTLADELNNQGVYATSHSHTDWKPIADKAAADYKAKKEGPIILVGHSLGADAVMEMADYLGDKGVPVALVVPFDGTQSFPVPANVARVVNLTQRDYAYMRPGPGFRGSLSNVDVSSDPDITHLNIDKSPQLHARVISEVLAVVGGHRIATPAAPKSAPIRVRVPSGLEGDTTAVPSSGEGSGKTGAIPETPTPRAKASGGAMESTDTVTPASDRSTPIIALPERPQAPATSPSPVTSQPPQKPLVTPQPLKPVQLPD
jgi:alpha-beta hydrolase superfamily lysophospholipase